VACGNVSPSALPSSESTAIPSSAASSMTIRGCVTDQVEDSGLVLAPHRPLRSLQGRT
jgi:hypothetical protein